MRFANLCDHASTSINIGDYLQFTMIDRLYEKMGINKDDVYRISGKELRNYRGEKLLLPLNFIATIFMSENKLSISEDIIPVFVALSLSNMKEKLDLNEIFSNQDNREFFLKHSPIGCRDEYTYRIFCEQKIPAYLNGCMTATLPKRECNETQKKVFFADAPERLMPYIPKELFQNCEFVSQQAQFSENQLSDYKKIFDFINNRYEKYKKEARLVVTSRLHVAVPCTAMGIPVVFAKDYIDTRFSWLEKLIPLYDIERYKEIDWTPCVPDYEEQKARMISLAVERIRTTYAIYSSTEIFEQFYTSRQALPHYYDSHDITHKNTMYLESFAQKMWSKEKSFKFGLWGITANSGFWIDWVCEHYPNAEFSVAIDSLKTGEIHGIKIIKPSELKEENDCCIVVIAVSAVPGAKKRFKELGYDDSKYCIAVDSFIIEKSI